MVLKRVVAVVFGFWADIWLLRVLSLSLVLFFLARANLDFPLFDSGIPSICWLPGGFGLAVFAIASRRYWPAYAIGFFLAFYCAHFYAGVTVAVSAGLSAIRVFESILAAFFLRKTLGRHISFETFKQVAMFTATAIITSGISAGLGTLVLTLGGQMPAPFFIVAQAWWATTLLGTTVFAAIIIAGKTAMEHPGPRRPLYETAGLAIGMTGAIFLVFSRTPPLGSIDLTLTNLPFPFLIWAALRFGPFGVSLSWTWNVLWALGFTLEGRGPMMLILGTAEQQMLWLHTYLDAGIFIGLMLASVVSERQRVQIALQEQAQCHAILNNVNTGIGLIAPDGTYVQSNERLAHILHYAPDQFLPKTVRELVHPDDLPRMEEFLKLLFSRSVHSFRLEQRFLCQDGRVIWGDVSVTPLQEQKQRIDGAVTVVSDITERKQAEEEQQRLEAQMQHTQKLESLGVLAGGIAHDFNNLLTGILGNVDLAKTDLPRESDCTGYLKEVETGALRAADLCRQLLAYSGKGQRLAEILDLSDLVREMAQLLEISISKKAAVRYHFPPDLPPIEADPTQVRQIIMNLITNASDALGDNPGAISIATGIAECDSAYLRDAYFGADIAPGYYVFVEVADSGCGMEPGQVKQIFEPFFTTKTTGRGLGLSAVMGIVRKHRGAVHILSSPGKGTTFRVLFPVSKEPCSVTIRQPEFISLKNGNGSILVIDDEETVRVLAKRVLSAAGYEVLTACDGAEGFAIFNAHKDRVRAVLLDLIMPNMSGDEMLEQLLQLRMDIPVILSSGYSEKEARARMKGNGEFSAFLQKPYRGAELLAAVNDLLGC